jgi:hypothetical protein
MDWKALARDIVVGVVLFLMIVAVVFMTSGAAAQFVYGAF